MIVSHVKSRGEGLAKERSGHQERGTTASVVGSCYICSLQDYMDSSIQLSCVLMRTFFFFTFHVMLCG